MDGVDGGELEHGVRWSEKKFAWRGRFGESPSDSLHGEGEEDEARCLPQTAVCGGD